MIDIHLHIIPSIDDGPATLAESRRALRTIEDAGYETVIATPHLRASLIAKKAALDEFLTIADDRWHEMLVAASDAAINLRFRRGYEIMLDEPRPDLSDPKLRLAKTKFVLVEFPGPEVPPNSDAALAWITDSGFTPIVSHPERYWDPEHGAASVFQWKDAGACLQLNMGSILGTHGPQIQKNAWWLLERGLVEYIGSDYHGRGEHLATKVREEMDRCQAMEQFTTLATTNPARLLDNDPPLEVSPVVQPKPSWRSRLFRRGR